MEEVWKDIKGYEGLYQVSNFGRVKSFKKEKIKILHCYLQSNGYYSVSLSKFGIITVFSIHRLVAETFIPNPDNLPCVDHIDGNKQNNCVNNLRWVSYKDNYHNPNTINNQSKFKFQKGHIPHNKGKSFLQISGNNHWKHKPVLQFGLKGNYIREWVSASQVQKELSISQSAISGCCRNKPHCKTAGGYIWKYKETV